MEGVPYPLDQNLAEYPSAPVYPLQTYTPDQPYPTQQYPSQQPEYFQHQQQGYPPQQQYYPPQQPQYPPAPVPTGYLSDGYRGDAPPPYHYIPQQQEAQPVQQQSQANVVIVQQQPTAVYSQTTVHVSGASILTLSVILTILCFLCGTWFALLCTVPAIIYVFAAKEAESRGDLAEAGQKRKAALSCNIIACVAWVISGVLIIILTIIIMSATRNV